MEQLALVADEAGRQVVMRSAVANGGTLRDKIQRRVNSTFLRYV